MQLTNEWIEKGKVEGRRETVVRILRRRFGPLPADLGDRIAKLADERMDELVEATIDFQNISDASAWVNSHS